MINVTKSVELKTLFSPSVDKVFLLYQGPKIPHPCIFSWINSQTIREKPHENDSWDKVGYVNNIDSDIMIICDQYDQINKKNNMKLR